MAMGALFFLSHQPGDSLYLPPVPNIDKLAHAVVYGGLESTVIFAFNQKYKEARPILVMVCSVIFCFCYGISDEYHQSFVPGRSASGYDVLADVCGAFSVCLLWRGYVMHKQRKAKPAEKIF